MQIIGFDFETYLIERGNITPKPVCLTYAVLDVERPDEPVDRGILVGDDMRELMELIVSPDSPWEHAVAHNAPYDLWVAITHLGIDPLKVFEAVESGRIIDTRTRETLAGIAYGWSDEKFASRDPRTGAPFKTNLAACVLAHFRTDISAGKSGPDVWRLRYSELDGVPLEDWPVEAVAYAMDDPLWTAKVAVSQANMAGTLVGSLQRHDRPFLFVDETEQTASSMALSWCAINGPRTEEKAVRQFREYHEAEKEKGEGVGKKHGFLRWNPKRFDLKRLDDEGRKMFEPGWSEKQDVLKTMALGCYPKGIPIDRLTDTGKKWAVSYGVLGDRVKMAALDEITYTTDKGEPKTVPFYKVVSTSEDALAALEDKGEVGADLALYGGVATNRKMINQYAPILETAVHTDLTSSPWFLVATGRTSWRDPNMQNPPRKGGFRECFVARPGNVYVSIDYSAIELVTLAQVHLLMFGQSALADVINAGMDPHTNFAAHLLGIGYEEAIKRLNAGDKAVKETRQAAKAANFGFPGGMGPATVVETYGVAPMVAIARPDEVVDGDDEATAVVVATRLREDWRNAYPEERRRQLWVGRQTADGSAFTYKQPISGRIRGGLSYCNGCNTPFQGMAADGGKAALVRIAKRSLAGKGAWRGVVPWLFVHDEIILEGPADTVTEWAYEASRIMVQAMREFTPDVKVSAEPAACRRWYKDAETLTTSDGRLIPWEPWFGSKEKTEDGQDIWILDHVTRGRFEAVGDLTPDAREALEAHIFQETAP